MLIYNAVRDHRGVWVPVTVTYVEDDFLCGGSIWDKKSQRPGRKDEDVVDLRLVGRTSSGVPIYGV